MYSNLNYLDFVQKVLCCLNCKRKCFDFSSVSGIGIKLKGHLLCNNCSIIIEIKRGVFIFPSTATDKLTLRTIRGYSDLWKRSGDSFETTTYSNEFEQLKLWAPLFRNSTVADIGCGNGRLVKQWIRFGVGHLILIDPSNAIFDCAERFIKRPDQFHTLCIQASLDSLPIENASAELTWCSGTLGLVKDQNKGLIELLRVSDKRLILSVLTESTWTGRALLGLNFVKPLFHHLSNLDLLYKLSGILARLFFYALHFYKALGLRTPFFSTETINRVLSDPNAFSRLRLAIYDPIMAPKITKFPNLFYIKIARNNGFKLKTHFTAAFSDYFDFSHSNGELSTLESGV